MILFKSYHMPLIESGIKTQTRRKFGRKFKVGSVHEIKTGFRKADFCGYIEILGVREERLGAISLADAKAEGYDSIDSYKQAFMDIYGSWDDSMLVQVIDFRYLGREVK